jgi:tetratricopeptide (TPR) repeat protein
LGPLFKGREAALVDLKQRLTTGKAKAVGLPVHQAIHGLGGVGKTRAAVEYGWRQASDYENALLFVSARSPADFRSNLAALCNGEILNLPEQNNAEEAARLAAVLRWLNEHTGWLLILDGVDTPQAAAELEKTLPKLQGRDAIITSRIADWSTSVQTTELDVLAEKDAAAFLLDRTEQRRKKTATETDDVSALAHELGGLALALEQAGAYIAKNHFSFSEYRRRWETTRENVLGWYDTRLMNYASSVAMTWQTSVDQLADPERALLNILAWLAPEPIPVSLLEGVSVDDTDARDALNGLASSSLVRWNADGDTFTIHRLVQEITRQRLSDNEKVSALDRALEILGAKLPSEHWDREGWQLWERLAPHCRTLLGRLRDHALEPKAALMMNQLALGLTRRAEHGEAETLFQRALAVREKALGPDHPEVGVSLHNLAALYKAQSRYAQAEPLFHRAIAVEEKALGPDHPSVAIALKDLATLYRIEGRYTQADPLFRRALAISEKALGSDHPSVAITLNDLATLYHSQRRYAQAESLYQRALAVLEKALGPDHPDLTATLNNLADVYRVQGRYAEAEPLFQRALATREKALGPDHPDVAASLSSLAALYRVQGSYAQAESLYQRAHAIFEKALGPDHPDLAVSIHNLGTLYHVQGRYAQAEPLFRRALAVCEKVLGPDHPDLVTGLKDLAGLYNDQGRYAEVGPLLQRVLTIQEKALGPDHLEVTATLGILGRFYNSQGSYTEAEPLLRRALATREKILSPWDPDVATSLNNLAVLLQDTNRSKEAEPLMRRSALILLKFTRSTGDLRPDLRTVLSNYYDLLMKSKRRVLTMRISLSEREVAQRLVKLGQEAGFDSEGIRKLLDRISEQE